jgi:hypothetical protein
VRCWGRLKRWGLIEAWYARDQGKGKQPTLASFLACLDTCALERERDRWRPGIWRAREEGRKERRKKESES